jgi:NitT/TauT family transport system substrate-binding protein
MTRDRVEIGMLDPEMTRRGFLGGMGLAGASLAVFPAGAWAAEKAAWVHPAQVDHINVPAYIALKKGYWKDEGLEVSTKYFVGGGPLTQAVVAGQVPIGTGGFSTVVSARMKDIKVKWIAGCERGGAGWGIVSADPNIKAVADLKGRKIGTGRAGATSHWWALQVAKWQNWKLGSDVQVVAVGSAGAIAGALVSRQVDAAVLWPPNIPLVVHKNKDVRVVLQLVEFARSVLGGYEGEGWFATEDFIAKKPQVIQKLLKGYYKAVKYMLANMDEAAAIAAMEWKLDKAVVRSALDETAPHFKTDGAIDLKGCEVIINSMKDMGEVKGGVPKVSDLIDQRFLPVKA